MTTKNELKEWFETIGSPQQHSHMIVVTDTYDYEDYPVYVKLSENVHDVLAKIGNQSMSKITEIYSYSQSILPQLEEHRAWNI